MRQLFYISILTLELLSCNSRTENKIETKLAEPDSSVLAASKQTDTLRAITDETKQKECHKSTLATFWERSNKEFPFDGWLSECKDSIQKINSLMDSLIKQNVPNKITKQSFNLIEEWKLEYYLTRGWHGMPTDQIKNRNRCYYSKKNLYKLTGADILEVFKLSKDDFPLNYCPLIFTRGSKFNSEWTAIMASSNILLIRLVSSYPDGNQTSWQYEKLYLFAKVIE